MLKEWEMEEEGAYHVGGVVIPLGRFLAHRYGDMPREEIERRICEYEVGKYSGAFLRTRNKGQLILILMRLMEGRGCQ